MKGTEITKRQKDVLTYIKKYTAEHGYPPAIREICKGVKLSSPATVFVHMKNLDGFGEWSRKWGDRIFWAIVFVSLMIAGMLVYFGYVNDSSNGDFLNLL